MTLHCPSRGYSIDHDAPIERDGFWIDPRGAATWRGRSLCLTATQAEILFAIAAGDGRPVRPSAISERVGHDGDGNVVQVQVCRIRHRLADMGVPDPIRTVSGRGYRWAAAR